MNSDVREDFLFSFSRFSDRWCFLCESDVTPPPFSVRLWCHLWCFLWGWQKYGGSSALWWSLSAQTTPSWEKKIRDPPPRKRQPWTWWRPSTTTVVSNWIYFVNIEYPVHVLYQHCWTFSLGYQDLPYCVKNITVFSGLTFKEVFYICHNVIVNIQGFWSPWGHLEIGQRVVPRLAHLPIFISAVYYLCTMFS